MKVSNAVVFNNLLLMESRGNDGLKYDKFIDEKGRVGHFSKLIDYLFMCDLIEFGEEHEVLYLTDVGYDVLEAGSWYDPELVEDTEVDNRRELYYSSGPSSEAKEEKKPRTIPWFFSAIISSCIVGLGSYFFTSSDYNNQRLEIPYEEIMILLDSIETEKQQKPVYILEKTED